MKSPEFIILIAFLLFVGVALAVLPRSTRPEPIRPNSAISFAYEIVTIDGHQYIITQGHLPQGDSVGIVHHEGCPCRSRKP